MSSGHLRSAQRAGVEPRDQAEEMSRALARHRGSSIRLSPTVSDHWGWFAIASGNTAGSRLARSQVPRSPNAATRPSQRCSG